MRPIRVAITGGIAAGKSEALAAFARHGAATASSDAVVHDLLAHDEDVRAAIRARWGDDVVGNRARIGDIVFHDRDELGWLEHLLHPKTRAKIDDWLAHDEDVRAAIRARWGDDAVGNRARIGDIVFHDRDELAWLEQLLHPKTRAAIDDWLVHVDARLAVVEVPLLYETGGETRFDKVVVVTAPPASREARRAVADDRQARLIPDEEKLQRADFSYVNDGSLEALDAFVARVVENLLSSSAG